MKTTLRILALPLVAMSFSSLLAAETPKVSDHYNVIRADTAKGKTFSDVIAPSSVCLIALTGNHGIGLPFTDKYNPQFDSDQLFTELWKSKNPAQDWGLSATESILAEYTIITHDGRLFIVEVLQEMERKLPVSGVLLRGDGFGCRFPVSDSFVSSSTSTK